MGVFLYLCCGHTAFGSGPQGKHVLNRTGEQAIALMKYFKNASLKPHKTNRTKLIHVNMKR
jgi:hypothetical protein